MKYEVLDVPQPEDCQRCVPCLRLRLMEIGFIQGQKIEVEDKKLGLWMINILSDNDEITSRYALREEELNRICLKGVS
jgi:Fe2+ transport system protein FeoA